MLSPQLNASQGLILFFSFEEKHNKALQKSLFHPLGAPKTRRGRPSKLCGLIQSRVFLLSSKDYALPRQLSIEIRLMGWDSANGILMD